LSQIIKIQPITFPAHRHKNYWNEAVVFTTSNNSFDSTEISYLESHFTSMAMGAKRYEIKNGNEPTSGGSRIFVVGGHANGLTTNERW